MCCFVKIKYPDYYQRTFITESYRFIHRMLKQMTDKVTQEYSVDQETAEKDVLEFIEQVEKEGLVEKREKAEK